MACRFASLSSRPLTPAPPRPTQVITVRDFATVYDAYAQFEESVLTAQMEVGDSDSDSDSDSDDDDASDSDSDDDVEFRLARLEHLTERRPLLLSSVLLRQNPHNVNEWHKRIKLVAAAGDPLQTILCFTEALKTVVPKKATGKPHSLWLAFAKFYEGHGDLENASAIFRKAVLADFKSVDELASVWCAYAEVCFAPSLPPPPPSRVASAPPASPNNPTRSHAPTPPPPPPPPHRPSSGTNGSTPPWR